METRNKTAKLATYNVHGLSLNVDSVKSFIDSRKPDVLVLTETWMKPEHALPFPAVHISAMPKQMNIKGRNRGGVSVVFNSRIRPKLLFKMIQQDYQLWLVHGKGSPSLEHISPLV